MSSLTNPAESNNSQVGIDTREALFNGGAIGPINKVQVSTECIVSLRGILLDMDPDIIKGNPIFPIVPSDPAEFYATVVRPMLNNHPVLAKAEVRNSGRGNHGILRFDKPVEFKTDGERDRWAGVVEVVQAALPVDCDAPGITATTRAIDSINSKNGATVCMLTAGEPVTKDEVLGLFKEMVEAPFQTVMKIMTGDMTMEPCPLCGKEGTKLSALRHKGRCYGSCGDVKLEQLYDLVLASRDTAGKEAADNA